METYTEQQERRAAERAQTVTATAEEVDRVVGICSALTESRLQQKHELAHSYPEEITDEYYRLHERQDAVRDDPRQDLVERFQGLAYACGARPGSTDRGWVRGWVEWANRHWDTRVTVMDALEGAEDTD